MAAHNEPLVLSYSHLQGFHRQEEALARLKQLAALTRPIMWNRRWRVPLLAEFYPEHPNLLGTNTNRGARICVRLRSPWDSRDFLPMEQVMDTFLHELAHNEHGPHDAKFHALWDELRNELENLLNTGYLGDLFSGKGHVLGGRFIPPHERQRRWLDMQGKRLTEAQGASKVIIKPGRKLGGSALSPMDDIRAVIARAAESRLGLNHKTSQSSKSGQAAPKPPNRAPGFSRPAVPHGCGNQSYTDREVIVIEDDAIEHGFRTKAEEAEANDAAIAHALAESFAAEAAGQPEPPGVGFQDWSCPRCTLINSLADRACVVCEFDLAG